jgi:hypothetical protein
MRIVSSLHEIGLREESMSRSPTPSFAGGRALWRVPVAADARLAPKGMSLQEKGAGSALECSLTLHKPQGKPQSMRGITEIDYGQSSTRNDLRGLGMRNSG